jgi:hypothetical protein
MRKSFFIIVLSLSFLLLLLPGTGTSPATHSARAQDGNTGAEACDTLISQALERSANVCAGLGRNEACLGYPTVSAVLANPAAVFEARGDIAAVTDFETLITRPIDPDTGDWGIVMMDIQADLPENTDGSVRLLLFGGAELEPATDMVVDNRPTCAVTNDSPNNLNLRTGPNTVYPAVDVFDQGDTLSAYGRNTRGDWLLSNRGWVYAPLTTPGCDIENELPPITNASEQYVAPMQAFTLRMDETAQCNAAPTGMMVQTPAGQTANLMVNNVELRIGSTAFIRLEDGNRTLTVANLEGNVKVKAAGFDRAVPLGAEVSIPLRPEDEAAPTGYPDNPRPLSETITAASPELFKQLPEVVRLPDRYEPPVADLRPGEDDPRPVSDPRPADDPTDPRPGEWGACGSCDSCNGPRGQCVLSPDGRCVWDPTRCSNADVGPAPTATPAPTASLNATDQNCFVNDVLTVVADYTSSDGAFLDSASVTVDIVDTVIAYEYVTPNATTSNVQMQFKCANDGMTDVTVSGSDSQGRSVSTTFQIHVQP